VQNVLSTKGDEIAEAVGSRDTPATGVGMAAQQASNVVEMPKPPQAPAAAEPAKRTRKAAAPADPLAGGFAQQAAPQPQRAPQAPAGMQFDDAPQVAGQPAVVPSDAALDGLLSGIQFN